MKVLVAEPERQLRDLLVFFLESEFRFNVLSAESLATAKTLIGSSPDLACVLSASAFADGDASDLFASARKAISLIPFILCSGNPLSATPEIESQPEVAYVPKPWVLDHLKGVLPRLLPLADRPDDETAVDREYCRIRLLALLRFGMLSEDLYIKLSSGRYVKVMQQHEVFDVGDYSRFRAKNVEFLYLKAQDARLFILKLAKNIERLSKVKEQGASTVLGVAAGVSDVISEMNAKLGFTPEIQELVQESVALALKSIRSSPKLSALMQVALDRDGGEGGYLPFHSAALAYVACGLASLVGWESETTFHKLSLAAFLHDLPLDSSELAKIKTTDELEMLRGREQGLMERVRSHPDDAASLLVEMGDALPGTDIIIRQHHERGDGSGFPRGLTHSEINSLSCVFLIAHEFLDYRLAKGKGAEVSDFVNERGHLFTQGYFRRLLKAMTDQFIAKAR